MLFEDICCFQPCAPVGRSHKQSWRFLGLELRVVAGNWRKRLTLSQVVPAFASFSKLEQTFQPFQPFQPQFPSLGICYFWSHFGHKAGWKRTSRGTIGTTLDAAGK